MARAISCACQIRAIKAAISSLESDMRYFQEIEESFSQLNSEHAKLKQNHRRIDAEKATVMIQLTGECDPRKAAQNKAVGESFGRIAVEEQVGVKKQAEEGLAAEAVAKKEAEERGRAEGVTNKKTQENFEAEVAAMTESAERTKSNDKAEEKAGAEAAIKKEARERAQAEAAAMEEAVERAAAEVAAKKEAKHRSAALVFTKKETKDESTTDAVTKKENTKDESTAQVAAKKEAKEQAAVQATGQARARSLSARQLVPRLKIVTLSRNNHDPALQSQPMLFNGTKWGIRLSSLEGWAIALCKPYSLGTTMEDFKCAGVSQDSPVLIATRKANDDTLMVAAIGGLDIITAQNYNQRHNGVYWTNNSEFMSFTPTPLIDPHHDYWLNKHVWYKADTEFGSDREKILMLPMRPLERSALTQGDCIV